MKIFKKRDNLFAGSIIGLSGIYENAVFRIDANEVITIGRDPKTCQIVVDENCSLISRTHCSIRGNMTDRTYTVTDHSKNGTFVNGSRIPNGVDVVVDGGSVISVGDDSNMFKLN